MLALWLALLLAAWGAVVGSAGAFTGRQDLSESGERGVHAASVFVAMSLAGLANALAVGDLTYRYVASWSSSLTPLPYRLGAVWAGPSGSLLVWALVLGVGSSVAAATLPRRGTLLAWTTAVLAILLLAVLGMACFDTNPFTRLQFAPDDGRGLLLEWMRPVVLVQMPLGYLATAMLSVPAVMVVMGALGGVDSWRDDARRWVIASWALLAAAMLLDWRRAYGVGEWVDDWRWAPVHAGTAFAWVGASLLVVAVLRRWPVAATIGAGFVAFVLGLCGLTLRRANGWDGVHAFALTAPGRATGWVLLVGVIVAVVAGVRALRADAARGLGARAWLTAQLSALAVAIALTAAGYPRVADLALSEGTQEKVIDRFGTPWALSLEGVSAVGRGDVVSRVVAMRATVNGRARAFVVSELQDLYVGDSRTAVEELTVAGIASSLAQDLRVDVRETNTADAIVGVRFVPGVAWIWIAGLLVVIAAFVAAFAPAPAPVGAPESPSAIEEVA